MPVDVAIVGAGAAGLACAAFLAADSPGAAIAVLDGARTLGAKILVSGGGRCNVTNREVSEADFDGSSPAAIRRVLRAFTVNETIAFFGGLGVPLREEPLGKLFPVSNRARSVLDALVGECRARGASVHAGRRVLDVAGGPDGFRLETAGGALAARRVVLATGGLALPRSGSDGAGYGFATALGHSIVPTTPALVPLRLDGDFHVGLAGVTQEVTLRLVSPASRPRTVEGSLLWTHVGVSGPAVLDLSRHWLRERIEDRTPCVLMNQVQGAGFVPVDQWLVALGRERPRLRAANALAERVPAAVAAALAREAAGVEDARLGTLTRDARRSLAQALTARPLPVRDSRGYTHAEATAGGVPLAEVDTGTMASRRCPGLFLVGEILDVDGRLGGFNFQWAWASARVAARGIARQIAAG